MLWIRKNAIHLLVIGLVLLAAVVLVASFFTGSVPQFLVVFSWFALIGIATVYGVLFLLPEGPTSAPRSASSTPDLMSAYLTFAEGYGIGYENVLFECTIGRDGSARVDRTVHWTAYSRTEIIDTYLVVEEPTQSGRPFEINTLSVRPLGDDRSLSLMRVTDPSGKVTAAIHFSPPLQEKETTAYKLTQIAEAGTYELYRSQGQDDKDAKTFYFAWNINRPTKRLLLQVYFPLDAKPDNYKASAHYASASGLPASTEHHKEQGSGRLKTRMHGPLGDRYVLELDVNFPFIGLIYKLEWKPSAPPLNRRTIRQEHEFPQAESTQ